MNSSIESDPETWQPFFKKANVSIIGLGLIGGSLALDLRPHVLSITAYDPDESSLAFALHNGWVDAGYVVLNEEVCHSDLILLAAPVRSIIRVLGRLERLMPCRVVVIDVGSTKQAVVQAMEKLPTGFDPLGGHPMSGKEKGKLINAEKGLFTNAPFALVPLPRTSLFACQVGLGLCDLIHARPVWLDALTHDQYVAAVSHLPYLLAEALTLSVSAEAIALAGPGFRGASRLAACDPSMMMDILCTNRQAIIQNLDICRQKLDILKTLLESDNEEALFRLLSEGKSNHAAFSLR